MEALRVSPRSHSNDTRQHLEPSHPALNAPLQFARAIDRMGTRGKPICCQARMQPGSAALSVNKHGSRVHPDTHIRHPHGPTIRGDCGDLP